jgi:hypothetical protein
MALLQGFKEGLRPEAEPLFILLGIVGLDLEGRNTGLF